MKNRPEQIRLNTFNYFIHGTNSAMLPLASRTGFKLDSSLDLLLNHQLAPFTGELTTQGASYFSPHQPGATARFGKICRVGDQYDLPDILKGYAKTRDVLSLEEIAIFLQSCSVEAKATIYLNFLAILFHAARYRQLGGDLNLLPQIQDLISSSQQALDFFYFYLICIHYLDVDTEALSGLSSEAIKKHAKLFEPLAILKQATDMGVSLKDIYLHPSPDNLQKLINILTIKDLKAFKIKDSAPISENLMDPGMKTDHSFHVGRKDFIEQILLGKYEENEKLEIKAQTFQGIQVLEERIALLKKLMQEPFQGLQLSAEETALIQQSFPIIFCHDKVEKMEEFCLEYCLNAPVYLGQDIQIVATDTQAHRLELEYYFLSQNLPMKVVLIDDLKVISRKLKNNEPIVQTSYPAILERSIQDAYHQYYGKPYDKAASASSLLNADYREDHGIMHAVGCMDLIPKIDGFYRKHVQDYPETFFSLAKYFHYTQAELLELVQITALFHDAAREGNGVDRWDAHSGQALYDHLILFCVPLNLAGLLRLTIVHKDDPESFIQFSKKFGDIPNIDYLRHLVNMADTLEIIRVTPEFRCQYLPICQVEQKKLILSPETLRDDVANLVTYVHQRMWEENRLKGMGDRRVVSMDGKLKPMTAPQIKLGFSQEHAFKRFCEERHISSEPRVIPVASLAQNGLFSGERKEAKVSVNQQATLMSYVVEGNQVEAVKLVMEHPEWLQQSMKATDPAGRSFDISPYQYLYWVGDVHMMRALQPYINTLELKSALESQCLDVKTKGITYLQDGKMSKESKQFDYSLFEKACIEYEKIYEEYITGDTVERTKEELSKFEREYHSILLEKWANLRDAQWNLPMHVIQEICRPDRGLYVESADDELPTFNEDSLPRVSMYRNEEKSTVQWLSGEFKGRDDILYRIYIKDGSASWAGAIARKSQFPSRRTGLNERMTSIMRCAISKLAEVRAEQRNEFLPKTDPEDRPGKGSCVLM